MKDYASMSDIEIDTMVSKICSPEFHRNYCNNPADAWPIIVENKISIYAAVLGDSRGEWGAESSFTDYYHFHNNPLRSAMIVFLMMKEGE